MAKKSSGMINHYGAISLRVVGSGNLYTALHSLQEFDNVILAELPMSQETDKEPTVLCNFNKQRAQVNIRTVNINEVFIISKLIIWTKPVASSYPQ